MLKLQTFFGFSQKFTNYWRSIEDICVSLVVSFYFLAPDQWPLPVLRLSCNYTTVWGIWVFKRSNTVSVLSHGTDLRRVSHVYKRSLAPFWCHTNTFDYFFVLSFFVFFCLTFMYGEWASKMSLPLICDCWEEDGRWNRSSMQASKHRMKEGKKNIHMWITNSLMKLQENL